MPICSREKLRCRIKWDAPQPTRLFLEAFQAPAMLPPETQLPPGLPALPWYLDSMDSKRQPQVSPSRSHFALASSYGVSVVSIHDI